MDRNVGLLGCGRMGAAMAGHLLRAGTPLSVYDPAVEAVRPLAEAGARVGSSPADVAASSHVVFVVVVDDDQVRAVVPELVAAAAEGTVVAVCASVRPDTCAELERLGAAHGVSVVDAALVRGERGAEEGALVLYCGGDEAAIEAVRRAAEPFTEAVLRVGAIGAGQVAKTANNILLWACIRADVEAQRLGRALGVEPAKLREAMAIGSGANRPLAEWGKHRLRWPHKDLEVALAVAAEVGVDMELVAQLPRLMQDLTVGDLHELL
jgi:3-hydroxyisobutyrate dehydrogenase-like beta-hydroxyacid dehydrogenase